MSSDRDRKPDDLARRAVAALGIAGRVTLSLVRHGENVVYRVDSASGRIALRLHRPGYHTLHGIASELAWMRALALDGVATPAVRPAPGGELVSEVRAPTSRGHGVRLAVAFDWVEGARLEASEPVAAFPLLGELMARMHLHSRSWTRPPMFTRPAWDAAGLVGPASRWGAYERAAEWDRVDLVALHRARDVVERRLEALGTSADVFGLVHADLTPSNVLVADGRPNVIDFDDCGPGWFAYDAAVSLWEYETDARFSTLRDGLAEGYRRVSGFDLPALDELPTFLMARRLALLGWLATRSESTHARATTARRVATTRVATNTFLRWADAKQPRQRPIRCHAPAQS